MRADSLQESQVKRQVRSTAPASALELAEAGERVALLPFSLHSLTSS